MGYLNELDVGVLEDYLMQLLRFLCDVTRMQCWLYLGQDLKTSIEVTMISVMAVSGLKTRSSGFSTRVSALVIELSSNLLVAKTAKD